MLKLAVDRRPHGCYVFVLPYQPLPTFPAHQQVILNRRSLLARLSAALD